MDEDNSFEKYPGSSIEKAGERSVPEEQDFAKSFESGVPEFAGSSPNYPDENRIKIEEQLVVQDNIGEELASYDNGLANATAIINYGLDAASREIGVEHTIQLIKNFDATSSENPIRDLYKHLGIDTPDQRRDIALEAKATEQKVADFREDMSMPTTTERSRAGALKAIADMKELISEVESADPRYAELRAKAQAAGKGYFDYAVKDFGTRGLTELFSVLMEQKEAKNQANTAQETSDVMDNQAVEQSSNVSLDPF